LWPSPLGRPSRRRLQAEDSLFNIANVSRRQVKKPASYACSESSFQDDPVSPEIQFIGSRLVA
jgi:hypothetical protein